MHHITSSNASGATSIEVDGGLGVVAAYDLLRLVDQALEKSTRVDLDLTRVTSVDPDGVAGLRKCCAAAVAAGVVLSMSGCSRPFRDALVVVEQQEAWART